MSATIESYGERAQIGAQCSSLQHAGSDCLIFSRVSLHLGCMVSKIDQSVKGEEA